MKYFFRAKLILEYDPVSKQVELPLNDDGSGTTNFEACNFIREDYALLVQFFQAAYEHADGLITIGELPEDFEVY